MTGVCDIAFLLWRGGSKAVLSFQWQVVMQAQGGWTLGQLEEALQLRGSCQPLSGVEVC